MPHELLFELKDARVTRMSPRSTMAAASVPSPSRKVRTAKGLDFLRRATWTLPIFAIWFEISHDGISRRVLFNGCNRARGDVGRASPSTHLAWLYVLVLRISSGDVDAVTSRNKEFVSNLQKAVEQALVVRAREPSVNEHGCSQWGGNHCAHEVRSGAITPSAGTPNVGN